MAFFIRRFTKIKERRRKSEEAILTGTFIQLQEKYTHTYKIDGENVFTLISLLKSRYLNIKLRVVRIYMVPYPNKNKKKSYIIRHAIGFRLISA